MLKSNKFIFVITTIIFAFIIPGCRKTPEAEKTQEKKKRKYFRDLTYNELKINKERLVREGRKDTAINHLEKMLPLCNEIKELRDMTLEMADLLFDVGNLKKAETLYSQFVQLYPGDKNVEYASYKSILCSFWQTLNCERDQTKTKDTIDLAKDFLDRSDIFEEYSGEVENILVECHNRIFESEEKIFRFYLNRGDFTSAHHRLKNMEKEFKELIPDSEPKMILLACELAEKGNNPEMLKDKQAELQVKFPNYQETITVASNTKQGNNAKPKKAAADRF